MKESWNKAIYSSGDCITVHFPSQSVIVRTLEGDRKTCREKNGCLMKLWMLNKNERGTHDHFIVNMQYGRVPVNVNSLFFPLSDTIEHILLPFFTVWNNLSYRELKLTQYFKVTSLINVLYLFFNTTFREIIKQALGIF